MLYPLFTVPLAMIALSGPIPSKIHVKVFPHLNDFPPQGLDSDPSRVELRSASGCKIYEGAPESASSTGKLMEILPVLDLTLTDATLARDALWISCRGAVRVIRRGAQTDYSYSGPIYARASSTGPELIEVTSLNSYLRGVVPSEMPASWPLEALKAQAVAARTYAVFHIVYGRSGRPVADTNYDGYYDVDDTVLYQAYTGNAGHARATDEAVHDTGTRVLLYGNDVIQAYFSADAGGYTEDADHVWPVVAPYCVAKPELYPNAPIDHAAWGPWNVSFSMDELNSRLQSLGLANAANPIVGAEILEKDRDVSGRAKTVTLILADGSKQEIDGLTFEHALSLRSTLISIDVQGGTLEVQGRGFGHGVGMGQYGARVLAQLAGWDYTRILNFYYTGVHLTP